MICRKCGNVGSITIKKDYCYCETCYLVNINHKFRACIGKNKVITPNENILIGLSGGISSTVLIDLIHTGITLNSHKKLRVQPHFVHLTGEDRNDNIKESIVKQCNKYGFTIHIISMSDYTSSNHIFACDLAPSTTSNDFIKRIKHSILASVAKDLKCRLVFSSENATTLAAKLLSDLVIGRGAQIENDIGFSDDRYDNIRILRPLRDITKEELQHYINIRGLVPACNDQLKQNSLQSVINNFVQNLEKDSPATISTICKTADKIGSDNNSEQENQCVFCKGTLNKDGNKLTAIQATTFSRMVSYANTEHKPQMEELINSQEEISGKSMFPFIHSHLCYCCSRSYAEMDKSKLQQHIQRLIDT